MTSQGRNHPEDLPSRNALIAWLTIFVAVSFLIFASNLATIVTYYRNKPLRRRGVYCLINLAVADMFHGLLSMLWFIFDLDYIGIDFLPVKLSDRGLNLVVGLINTNTLVLSLFCLLLVSLDRVYATFFPFAAYSAASVKKYMTVFAITWGLSFLFSLIPSFFLTWDIYNHDLWFDNLELVCILSLVIIIVAYIAIFVKIRMQNQQLQQHQLQESIQRRERQEKHLAITLLIATILSLITWLPFIINHEVDIASRMPPGPARFHIELLTELIQLTNSLVNPIVYLFRMKEYRKALFQFLFKCSSSPIGNHSNTRAIQSMPMSTLELAPAE
ncbi:hypothetical protein QZH41_002816 [Actinostola sp. cb2023]|nr:hypothetical protein QZH41_002816 [Actinostola sp. cb2023]